MNRDTQLSIATSGDVLGQQKSPRALISLGLFLFPGAVWDGLGSCGGGTRRIEKHLESPNRIEFVVLPAAELLQ